MFARASAISHTLLALRAVTLSYHAEFFRGNGTSCNQACGEGRQDDVKTDYLQEDPRTRAGAAVSRCLAPAFMVRHYSTVWPNNRLITQVIEPAPETDLPGIVCGQANAFLHGLFERKKIELSDCRKVSRVCVWQTEL